MGLHQTESHDLVTNTPPKKYVNFKNTYVFSVHFSYTMLSEKIKSERSRKLNLKEQQEIVLRLDDSVPIPN